MRGKALLLVAALALVLRAAPAQAESTFLSRQYTRCTTCHFSPTGGGLLTAYGRSLSREELSTTGKRHSGDQPQGKDAEQAFLWGLLGDKLGPVSVGLDIRPSHLDVDLPRGGMSRDFLMNADVLLAYQAKNWTVYGEIGRQLEPTGSKIDSYEHWVGYQNEKGIGFRVGRFFPAYGIRLADHTALTRAPLGLDKYDQVYGLEFSHTTDRHLLQLSVGPGRADSIIDDDGGRAFTASARYQTDLGPRRVLVVSGLFRDGSKLEPKNGSGGVALGFAPTRRVTVWTEANAQFQQGESGAPAYALLGEASVEVYRGAWLKFSPQLRTDFGDVSGGVIRLAVEANLLPRTHWNATISYYRDRNRFSDLVSKTWLAQLHLYL